MSLRLLTSRPYLFLHEMSVIKVNERLKIFKILVLNFFLKFIFFKEIKTHLLQDIYKIKMNEE